MFHEKSFKSCMYPNQNVRMYIYLQNFYEKLRIGHFIHCSDSFSINNITYRTVKMMKVGHPENI